MHMTVHIGKVAIGKARYLLNIVLCTWMFDSSLFRFLFCSDFSAATVKAQKIIFHT
jgi:hypothetical protein